jgi:hypothetical protein
MLSLVSAHLNTQEMRPPPADLWLAQKITDSQKGKLGFPGLTMLKMLLTKIKCFWQTMQIKLSMVQIFMTKETLPIFAWRLKANWAVARSPGKLSGRTFPFSANLIVAIFRVIIWL